MPIIQAGSTNLTALVVPDIYVNIVPPQNLVINGVPTNIIGVVGTAPWGPTAQPATVGTAAEYAALFGPVMTRKYDMGTAVAAAIQQGAQDFVCVRATDGTDVAASVPFNGTTTSNCSFIATSLYTGSLANGDVLTLSAGTAVGSYRLTIARPGGASEIFDNITGATAAAFWANLVNAVNTGAGQLRGPSQLVTLAIGAGSDETELPSALTLPMATTLGTGTGGTLGTDGTTTITAAVLIGNDAVIPRKGMYALRSQGCSIGVLADADDSTQFTTQESFGLAEGIYMMLVTPAGSPIKNGSTGTVDLINAAGLDTYACKVLHGDWCYWNDQTNNTLRLISPQGFAAGRLSNLSPEQSGLNKPIYGVVGTQKSGLPGSGQMGKYSSADLQLLFGNRIDVISNPLPAGNIWGLRGGFNGSSNKGISDDSYTRLTNYIAATLEAGMGVYVGEPINDTLFQDIRSTQLSFLQNMLSLGLLGTIGGKLPFAVQCDASNNPQSQTGIGIVVSTAQIQYMGINKEFIVNIEAGATVSVTISN